MFETGLKKSLSAISNNDYLFQIQVLTSQKVRYDRQLRLWGEHGQNGLESARVLICGVNSTTTEGKADIFSILYDLFWTNKVEVITKKVAKNLILPGIGHVTLLDDQPIIEADLVSNFFYSPDSLGQKRSQVACELLAELNPSVKCDYDERAIDFLLQGINGFSLLIRRNVNHVNITMNLKFLSQQNTSVFQLFKYFICSSSFFKQRLSRFFTTNLRDREITIQVK